MKTQPFDKMLRNSASLSLLHILYECPYLDLKACESLFPSSVTTRTFLSRLMKRGLVETFEGQDKYLPIRKGYCLTEAGFAFLEGLHHLSAGGKLSAADESYPDRRLYLTGIPLKQKGLQRGKYTHFHDLDIVYLWLQLRWWKPQNFSLLWDNVKDPSILPLIGNPDLIFFDGINYIDGYFEDLMLVEYEASKKPDGHIFERIETLAKNDPVCILIVSKEEDILKDYANVVRKCLPESRYYTQKRTFGKAVRSGSLYANRIWFLQWDPWNNKIKENTLPQARVKRLDHPSFDMLTLKRFRADGSEYLAPMPHDRWDGDFEVSMGDLLEAFR